MFLTFRFLLMYHAWYEELDLILLVWAFSNDVTKLYSMRCWPVYKSQLVLGVCLRSTIMWSFLIGVEYRMANLVWFLTMFKVAVSKVVISFAAKINFCSSNWKGRDAEKYFCWCKRIKKKPTWRCACIRILHCAIKKYLLDLAKAT